MVAEKRASDANEVDSKSAKKAKPAPKKAAKDEPFDLEKTVSAKEVSCYAWLDAGFEVLVFLTDDPAVKKWIALDEESREEQKDEMMEELNVCALTCEDSEKFEEYMDMESFVKVKLTQSKAKDALAVELREASLSVMDGLEPGKKVHGKFVLEKKHVSDTDEKTGQALGELANSEGGF